MHQCREGVWKDNSAALGRLDGVISRYGEVWQAKQQRDKLLEQVTSQAT